MNHKWSVSYEVNHVLIVCGDKKKIKDDRKLEVSPLPR